MDTHRIRTGGIRVEDTYWWDTHRIRTGGIRVEDTYWWDMYCWDTFTIPADAHLLNGYALNGYA